MKAFGLLAALTALAACSSDDRTSEAEPAPAAESDGWMPAPGTYEFTRSDGAAGLIMLAEGGEYTAALSGGDLEAGVWQREGNASCLVPAADEAERLCYRFTAPDARGRFSGTAPDGATINVRLLE